MHSVIGSARIKCGQKGREYTASLKNFTNEDGTHAEEDLVEGKELMWEVKGKSYPVTFLHIYVKGTFGFTHTCVNFYIVTVLTCMQVGSSVYMHRTNIRGYMHGVHMWFLETRVQQMRVNVNHILTSTYILFFLCVHWAVVMINVGLTQVRPK